MAAERSILFAGGIGVTPIILCMAERLASSGAEFEMHYCARSRERTAFAGRLEASAFFPRVALHFDDGLQSQRLDAKALLAAPASGAHLYVCGPTGFMDHVMKTAREQGWLEESIHFEYFAGQTQAEGANTGFHRCAAHVRARRCWCSTFERKRRRRLASSRSNLYLPI